MKKTLLFIYLSLIVILKIQLLFLSYIDFKSNGYKTLEVKVINQYKKKNYYVLKLANKDFQIYTTTRDDIKNLLNESLKVTFITKNLTFFEFLKAKFYLPSFNLKLEPVNYIEEKIENEHRSKKLSNIFKALFLGESIDYKTRQELSTLGISHLIALSGLHLGIISGFLFLILSPVYTFFHRFFPYRNRYVDLGIIILIIEFFYLYFTNFPPSLIRAFMLEVVLFLFMYYLKNPFSLKILAVVFIFSFLFFDMKVFSIGYFLSIMGVFYIYLFFRYFKPTLINGIILSFYMYGVMFVLSHYFFGNFNLYQLFSPLYNLLFTLFYPLEIVLHIIGFGGIFDEVMDKFLHLGDNFINIKFSLWYLLIFLSLSLLAFFNKKAFYGINLLAVLSIVYAIGEWVV